MRKNNRGSYFSPSWRRDLAYTWSMRTEEGRRARRWASAGGPGVQCGGKMGSCFEKGRQAGVAGHRNWGDRRKGWGHSWRGGAQKGLCGAWVSSAFWLCIAFLVCWQNGEAKGKSRWGLMRPAMWQEYRHIFRKVVFQEIVRKILWGRYSYFHFINRRSEAQAILCNLPVITQWTGNVQAKAITYVA